MLVYMCADPRYPRGPRSLNSPEAPRSAQERSGTQVSAAWARVAGGSGSLNAWYQNNRLPRSADASTNSNDKHGAAGPWKSGKIDEKWAAFARQEVAELRLPSLQPQATFLL
jgi:hypothetical protein